MNELDPNDIVVQHYCSKHTAWNRTIPNGIRIVHKPTNTEVICERHRSQHQNRDEALNELRRQLGLPLPAPYCPR